VLNAPETARGKAVKCPGCETKVKVPAGDAAGGDESPVPARARAAKAPAKKKVEADSSDFLAALDLDKVVDSSEAMCPKCGAPLPEDATECPKCGTDPETGQLTASAKKRKNMKGPDPALFYRAAWVDSWAFTKENFTVGLRTFLYTILANLAGAGCVFMAGWVETAPPKVFFLSLTLLTFLIIPGWRWCVVIETVRVSAARKSNITRLNFDIFQNMALGLKTIIWSIVFWLWFPFALFMFPLAMVHMAMPVTKRAWLNFLMVPTFFRNLAPSLYFWVIVVATQIPLLAILGLSNFMFSAKIQEMVRTQGKPSFPMSEAWVALGVILTAEFTYLFVNSFLLLFYARVIGLLAFYFQNSLDLVTFIAEKEYKRKNIKVDRWGIPIKTTEQKVKEAVFLVVVLGVVSAAGYWIYVSQFKGKS
jgi:ribosomal protein L40E